MELEVFDGWTIDRRLKQLRKIDENDKILFVDFDSELGQLVFEKKILIDELDTLIAEMNEVQDIADEHNNGNINPLVNISQATEYQRLINDIKDIQVFINKLEKEQK